MKQPEIYFGKMINWQYPEDCKNEIMRKDNDMIDNTKMIERADALNNLTEEDRKMLKRYGDKLGGRVCGVLRHHPEDIGVAMDLQAWVGAAELIEKFNAAYSDRKYYLSLPVLLEMVRTDEKQRYGLKWEGNTLMIRCRQGHSIPWLEMDYRVETPPEILYHGTIETFLPSILREGLKPMERQKVHLSWDIPTARRAAERRRQTGQPVLLRVDAGKMAADGAVFYLADNDVWLADHVCPEYISVKSIHI